ncbi:MAG: hypothetical protein OEN01_14195 [Candidatus Krumholzibacteria bacterium]|nr:hypothetical protein [Candidatus Krumholzibacteria bacterium]
MLTSRILQTALSLVLVAGLLSVAACSGDNNPVSGVTASAPPELPDVSTMAMDLSFFGLDGMNPSVAKNMDTDAMLAAAGTKANWINAVIRVLFVQLLFYDAFEEPVGAFALAVHSIPQKQPDDSWLWTYIFVEDTIEYNIFLFGKVVSDHVEWRMEVSSNNPDLMLDHFVWFDGESMLDDSSGYWQFYAPVSATTMSAAMRAAPQTEGVPSVRIHWENLGPRTHRLTVLVNQVGNADEGDRLEFYASPTVSWITHHDQDLQLDSEIRWYADGSGSISVPDYNDGQTACWDARQEDTVCP